MSTSIFAGIGNLTYFTTFSCFFDPLKFLLLVTLHLLCLCRQGVFSVPEANSFEVTALQSGSSRCSYCSSNDNNTKKIFEPPGGPNAVSILSLVLLNQTIAQKCYILKQ